jgi:thioredoxin reductase
MREPAGFTVQLATGEVLASARLMLAFGIADERPTIPGRTERRGTSVLHCPTVLGSSSAASAWACCTSGPGRFSRPC